MTVVPNTRTAVSGTVVAHTNPPLPCGAYTADATEFRIVTSDWVTYKAPPLPDSVVELAKAHPSKTMPALSSTFAMPAKTQEKHMGKGGGQGQHQGS